MERRPRGGLRAWSIPDFFERAGPFSLADVAKATGAELAPGADPARDDRRRAHRSPRPVRATSRFSTTASTCRQLKETRAGACLVAPAFAARVPAATVALVTKEPYRGFALALTLFYPDALQPKAAPGGGADARSIRRPSSRRAS